MAEILRTPDQAFANIPDYPFEPHYFNWGYVRMHYLDEGSGPPVVLFHGEPTWSFLYRKVIPQLVRAGYRCIAPDYVGFGKSDKPADDAFYTYDMHSESVAALLESLDLSRAAIVVQDWGGPIGLRFGVENPSAVTQPLAAGQEAEFDDEETPSWLPADLLDALNRDELLDLLAYLMSRGDPDATLFR